MTVVVIKKQGFGVEQLDGVSSITEIPIVATGGKAYQVKYPDTDKNEITRAFPVSLYNIMIR